MTVRHGLDILQMEGLIERRRGRTGGTFIRSIPPEVELTSMEGIIPQLREHGLEVDAEVLESGLVPAEPVVAEVLRVPVGEKVVQIVRLWRTRGTPLAVENAYFPAALVPGMLDHDVSRSLYELLDVAWDLRPVVKSETLVPGVASSWEQNILGVNRSLPLLRIRRTAITRDGVPVEYSEDVLRSDIAHIRVVTGVVEPDLGG